MIPYSQNVKDVFQGQNILVGVFFVLFSKKLNELTKRCHIHQNTPTHFVTVEMGYMLKNCKLSSAPKAGFCSLICAATPLHP